MKTKQKPETWHPAKTGNYQGLIIDDLTGATIAICYNKAYAPLIAAAPELLDACSAEDQAILTIAADVLSSLKRPAAAQALRDTAAKMKAAAAKATE